MDEEGRAILADLAELWWVGRLIQTAADIQMLGVRAHQYLYPREDASATE